jgi:hypothetical protein
MLCHPHNKQLERTVIRDTCAPHVRHFMMHTRRAGHVITPPLNCGVMPQKQP